MLLRLATTLLITLIASSSFASARQSDQQDTQAQVRQLRQEVAELHGSVSALQQEASSQANLIGSAFQAFQAIATLAALTISIIIGLVGWLGFGNIKRAVHSAIDRDLQQRTRSTIEELVAPRLQEHLRGWDERLADLARRAEALTRPRA